MAPFSLSRSMLKRPRNTTENNVDSSDATEMDLSLPLQLGGEQTGPFDYEYVGPVDEDGNRDEQDNSFDNEEEDEDEEDDDEDGDVASEWFDADTKSFLVSMLVHVLVVVGLASYTVVSQPEILALFIESQPIVEEIQPLDIINDIAYSETPSEEIGANSIGLTDMALSTAPVLADISEIVAQQLA